MTKLSYHWRKHVTTSRHQVRPVSTWEPYKASHGSQINALPEVRAVQRLLTFLESSSAREDFVETPSSLESRLHQMTPSQHLLAFDAAMATFSLHVHARIASLVGQGFYTIGPCGEELLAAAGFALEEQDSSALHYRHTALSMVRQLTTNPLTPHEVFPSTSAEYLDEVLLARARGYTVSRHDPVTGGVHCSIGGGTNEFLVTSTLSSQCPSAVGRALGYSLLPSEGVTSKKKPVSFVTIGDGSLHNHHFLSAFTLARHAKHLNIKCPVVFGISNNGVSISYKTKDYIDTMFGSNSHDPLVPVFTADAQDMQSIYDQTRQAVDYSRLHAGPSVLLFQNVVRRFGHAATDRQSTYLNTEEIQRMQDACVLQLAAHQVVEQLNLTTYAELRDRFQEIHFERTDKAFGCAVQEPKVTLDDMLGRVQAPLAPICSYSAPRSRPADPSKPANITEEKPQVMRKLMTRVYDELLQDPSVFYLGEDVRHGGYYAVTEGLASKYPSQVLDFPPDETTLLGAGLGFSQLGLTPIVEIPYAKYLDCGIDMFHEIAIQHWLSSPTSPHHKGMIIRLQGFDRGVFGGNFHTHNMLSIPPGVDVVCFSNGRDYVSGMRHAAMQAKAGRIVMVVDCTHLLNLRHLHEEDRDRFWECPFPSVEETEEDMLDFDTIRLYEKSHPIAREPQNKNASFAIVTFGNGVVTSLQARKDLIEQGVWKDGDCHIIDCPCLSHVPKGLTEQLRKQKYEHVLFADICKQGPGSVLATMIPELHQQGCLPSSWSVVGAPRTYNPLGSTVTFLNREQIIEAVMTMLP
eukprot:Nitzschia sp. Nitz4//scaffold118_size93875//46013//48415//NITZ4_004789-RA/size93875-processed-gene-0.61-mRNA-1//-1//CDS//3329533727//4411//frame0